VINGCEETNRNVCLYTSFSEGIALPCATLYSVNKSLTLKPAFTAAAISRQHPNTDKLHWKPDEPVNCHILTASVLQLHDFTLPNTDFRSACHVKSSANASCTPSMISVV